MNMTLSTETDPAVCVESACGAWSDAPSHLRLWIPAIALLVLDLWSKQWAFSALDPVQARPVVPGLLEFRQSLNDGAVFGSFTGYVGVFIAASLAALVFVLYMFGCSRRRQWTLHVALGLVLSGALGNLYDRAFIKADVVLFQADAGQQRSHIGTIVSEPDAAFVEIGEWPGGKRPRRYDRSEVTVRRQGVVRDFIKITPRIPGWVPKLGGYDFWPWVFNVADACLVIGVAALLLQSWFVRSHREETAS
jgi:signal peptidase II